MKKTMITLITIVCLGMIFVVPFRTKLNMGLIQIPENGQEEAKTEEDQITTEQPDKQLEQESENGETSEDDSTEQVIKKRVVIDAGHGGSDPGKIGYNGAYEKDVNLAIAKKLQEKLEKEDVIVTMTREKDRVFSEEEIADGKEGKMEDMDKRVKIINEAVANACISIHQNSYKSRSVKGPQVFFYSYSQEGKELAKKIQAGLNEEIGEGKGREIEANKTYFLLKRTAPPMVIVECGFMSNPEESENLVDDKYQDKLATVIADAVLSYLDEKEEQ